MFLNINKNTLDWSLIDMKKQYQFYVGSETGYSEIFYGTFKEWFKFIDDSMFEKMFKHKIFKDNDEFFIKIDDNDYINIETDFSKIKSFNNKHIFSISLLFKQNKIAVSFDDVAMVFMDMSNYNINKNYLIESDVCLNIKSLGEIKAIKVFEKQQKVFIETNEKMIEGKLIEETREELFNDFHLSQANNIIKVETNDFEKVLKEIKTIVGKKSINNFLKNKKVKITFISPTKIEVKIFKFSEEITFINMILDCNIYKNNRFICLNCFMKPSYMLMDLAVFYYLLENKIKTFEFDNDEVMEKVFKNQIVRCLNDLNIKNIVMAMFIVEIDKNKEAI